MILPYDPTHDVANSGAPPPDPGLGRDAADAAVERPTAQNAPPTPADSSTGAWAPFDPGDTPAAPRLLGGGGPVVAVVASPELIDLGWAVSVTVELARAWAAAEGPAVVLVDTNLRRPRLHFGVGVNNETGLAEVLEGNASVADATQVVDQDRLFCVSAGNAPDRPDHGFDPSRWARLCKAFSNAGIIAVVYVPVGAPWLTDVLRTATHVIELREHYAALPWTRPEHVSVTAVLGPMPLIRPPSDPVGKDHTRRTPLLGFSPADVTGKSLARPTADAVEEEARIDPTHTEEAVAGEQDSDGGSVSSDEIVPTGGQRASTVGGLPVGTATRPSLGPSKGRDSVTRRQRRTLVAATLAVGAVAFVLAFQFGSRGRGAPVVDGPDREMPAVQAVRPDAGGTGPGTDPGGMVPTAPVQTPVAPDAAYSVQVAAFTDEARAERHLQAYASALPSTPWTVVPVEIGGVVYHRVLAGLVADSASARALVAQLGRVGALSGTTGIVRETHLVYDFGAAPTFEEARSLATRLRAEGLPAGPVRVQQGDQSIRFHVYAGGFADRREAEYLGSRIVSMGIPADLAPRMGLPPD